jgi:serine/threonine-protein kinase RsbW
LPQITLTIASRFDAVPLLGQLVCSICLYAGMEPGEANEVEICAVEAVNNSIKHAYCEDPDQRVEVAVALESSQLTLDIRDSGRSVDEKIMNGDHLQAIRFDPKYPNQISESGRGLAIIQQVMDSFEYAAESKGNRFRMTKRLKNV